ncbi:MAG: type IV pilin N-terminal domain-containing protein, partial [Candidatus Thermoplasmatota archaeon]|nr:type IV pilin N-terminal domain-containing protein [Candidatus Thermoplasmatota archaeon]
AVSAVIGVILMVAITVAIAATVYVYVSGMIGGGLTTTENASVTVTGTNTRIKILLTKGGDGAPYVNDTAGGDTGFDVFINGSKIAHTNYGIGSEWEVGESIILTQNEGGDDLLAGVKYSLTVQIMGSTIYDAYITILS